MRVQVEYQSNVMVHLELFYALFHSINWWVFALTWVRPVSIHICTC